MPSTHLVNRPDLGIAMINGFAAELPNRPGIELIAPAYFAKILASTGVTMATKARPALAILGLTHCGCPPHAAFQAEGAAG